MPDVGSDGQRRWWGKLCAAGSEPIPELEFDQTSKL